MISFTRSGTCLPAGFHTSFSPAWFSPAPAGYSPAGFLTGLSRFLLSAGCLTSLICIVANCFFTSFFLADFLTGWSKFLTSWMAYRLERLSYQMAWFLARAMFSTGRIFLPAREDCLPAACSTSPNSSLLLRFLTSSNLLFTCWTSQQLVLQCSSLAACFTSLNSFLTSRIAYQLEQVRLPAACSTSSGILTR